MAFKTLCTVNKMLHKIKQINRAVVNTHCIYFICGLRGMDRGTKQQSATFKEKFADEVPKPLPAPQLQQHY